ncbi:MAG TPA: hypothetical protein VFI04_00340 [Gaiellaceae bacterium]|nr:hypothetical protein [Gaiellaceae bacterium]
MNQLDVNRVRATLAAALAAQGSPGVATLVYARAREAVRVLVAETRLAPEFEALFPVAYLELGAAPGYPEVLCRQLESWLAEVDAAREALALTPELALVDGSLRGDGDGAGPERHDASRVAGPHGINTPVGVAATAHILGLSARTLTIQLAMLLAVAAVVVMLAVQH